MLIAGYLKPCQDPERQLDERREMCNDEPWCRFLITLYLGQITRVLGF